MRLSGTGISTPFELKVTKYRPITTYGIEWIKTSSGNYVSTDRGASNDTYESEIVVSGHEYYINQVLSAIQDNRAADNHVLSLDTFNQVDDKIFGCDVDYSSGVTCTVVKLSSRKQRSWRGFGVTMILRALSPSFTGSASLPALQYIPKGYEGDATYTVTKYDTYDGSFTYLDEEYDAGQWTGDVILTSANMQGLRRYLATQRGSTISIPAIAGVAYPYGPRRGSTYPLSVKVTEFKDNGMWGEGYWTATLTLNEVVSET